MEKVILIDGNSLMYRAFFATAYNKDNIMKNSKGQYTNMLFGFAKMFEVIKSRKYDGILIAFDKGKKTFRHEMYEDYKAGRQTMPEELKSQIPLLHRYLKALNVKTYMLDNYEADDIIGTLAKRFSKENIKVEVISSDKDLLQLVDDNITVLLTKKGLTDLAYFTPEHLKAVYGLDSNQIIDYKALIGDASDNIKGIKGIGEKTALKLLEKYHTLDNVLLNRDEITGKIGELIKNNSEDAILSRTLVTICLEVPVDFEISEMCRKEENSLEVFEFYRELGFYSLLKNQNYKEEKKEEQVKFEVIEDNYRLKEILTENSALYLETDLDNYHQAKGIGFGISNSKGLFYVPFELVFLSMDFQLFLSDEKIEKWVYDYKKIHVLLKRNNLEICNVTFDLLLAAYVINPLFTKEDFFVICNHFDYFELEDASSDYKRDLFDDSIMIKKTVQKAKAIFQLKNKLEELIIKNNQKELFYDIEIPLSMVLGDMEVAGIRIDLNELTRQKELYEKEIKNLSEEIYLLTGKEFNINSPKQLGELLFETLGLSTGKKNKTGYSTDSDTLEKLKDEHPVIQKLIEYRALSKLSSTYIEGIKNTVSADLKVHTIYKQALTQTGRLSSIEPNLQNIPIRTERGREIRKFFIPENDENFFLSCDYSQIELRILAHLAQVDKLINAFNNNEDVHQKTAMEIFQTDEVTADLRRKAKAVNFGIIYGISSYGLSEDVKISPKEAKGFIEKYFIVYPEIKKYMDEIIEFAKEKGFVQTIMNRKRYIKELTSENYMLREFGKRTAMNAPIQGSAADIIKKAMVDIAKEFKKEKLRTKLLLQIHDELIFEVYPKEKEVVEKIIREKMENVISLKVPLLISMDTGRNLYEV